MADQHIQEIQEFGKKSIEKLEKIFEESNEKSARARKKISDNLADLEATRRRLEARQKARELHPLGLDPEDSQILSEILSALFYFFISKKFIFSMLLGVALSFVGYGLPFAMAATSVSLCGSFILSFARKKLVERFLNASDNTSTNEGLTRYFELGKQGQESWGQYFIHSITAPQSFLPFTQAGLHYQAGRRQKELEQNEEVAPQVRSSQNTP